MIELIVFSMAFIWLVFAVFSDLKKREIPYWLNFSLIVFVLVLKFFYSLFELNDFHFFYMALIGLGVFFILSILLYYGRVFAGGDALLMVALGPVFFIYPSFYQNIIFSLKFLILFFIVGAIYGVFYSLYYALINWIGFKKEFIKRLKKGRKKYLIYLFFGAIFFIISIFVFQFIYIGFYLILIPFLVDFFKIIDEKYMHKRVGVDKVTLGDYLKEEVHIGRDVVKPYWEGIDEKNLKKLKKYKGKVLIHYGIPFAPVFLISFLILVFDYFFKFFKVFF